MKKVVFVLGGGIGNIVQATPAVKSVAKSGYCVDLYLQCNSSNDLNIFKLKCVNKIITSRPFDLYDFQLNGPFTGDTSLNSKKSIKSRIDYAQNNPEVEVYYDLAKQMGIKLPMESVEINIGKKGPKIDSKTVAIYPGSKPDWAMKRWDKYDLLSSHFKNVLVIGTKEDINSHGNPTWIKRKWNWPKHVKFFSGKLQEAAYAISQCKMFIGNDGGLSHVAAATGVPTFVLFGPSSIVKNKPFSPICQAITTMLPCSPCQFKKSIDGTPIFGPKKCDCPFDIKCMKDMTVDFVINQISKSIQF